MLDGALLGPQAVWEASGHVQNFHDPMVDCLNCKKRYRVCLRKESEKTELFDGLQLCTAAIFSPNINCNFSTFNILKIEDIKKMTDLVIEKSFKLPNLNCGACGYQDCFGLAQEIVKGNRTIDDCPSLEPSTLVKVNGKIISMNSFIAKIVKNTIIGLLSTLKGFAKGDIEIKIKQK
jgi:molybdopterin-guanine dinucleotide biosynthesis protein B